MLKEVAPSVVRGLFDDPLFPPAEVAGLILKVGLPLYPGETKEDVGACLSKRCAEYALEYVEQCEARGVLANVEPGKAEGEAELERVEKACNELLRSMGVTWPIDAQGPPREKGRLQITPSTIPKAIGPGRLSAVASAVRRKPGGEVLVDMLSDVAALRAWAIYCKDRCKSDTERTAKPKRPGPDRDRALDNLLMDLTAIYQRFWGGEIGWSNERSRGDWREAEQVEGSNSLAADAYETGEPLPAYFGRYLCEIMRSLESRGLPVSKSSTAVKKRWERARRNLLPEEVLAAAPQSKWQKAAKQVGVSWSEDGPEDEDDQPVS